MEIYWGWLAVGILIAVIRTVGRMRRLYRQEMGIPERPRGNPIGFIRNNSWIEERERSQSYREVTARPIHTARDLIHNDLSAIQDKEGHGGY